MSDTILSLDNLDIIDNEFLEIEDIYEYIIDLIKSAEKIKDYKGEAKKFYVTSNLKTLLPSPVFNRFEPMLDKSIDFLVYLSKHPELLKEVNKVAKNCLIPCTQTMVDKLSCCCCCKK